MKSQRKMSDIELKAECYRVIRSNGDKPPATILKILKKKFGTSKRVWNITMEAINDFVG